MDDRLVCGNGHTNPEGWTVCQVCGAFPPPGTGAATPEPKPDWQQPSRGLVEWFAALPKWARELSKFGVVVGAVVVVIFIASLSGGDSDDEGPGSDPELIACPSSLEVLAERAGGGFVRGVDPQYDARMDWDGDGVSCE